MMIEKYFIVTLLDDIVLNKNSATTMGTNDTLDYIPGSNFLGIVAKYYDEFQKDAFDVFHSGKVRFGDAHIYNNNNTQSYKIPFSYFLNKGESPKEYKKLYFHHFITKEDKQKFKEQNIQLKQVRNGYFDSYGNLCNISYNYTQKSAYDKAKRRSKESSMFGYNAIKRGTNFIFEVQFDSKSLVDGIVEKLQGTKRIGKSKNNQYGRVKIELFNDSLHSAKEKLDENITLLYANSNLALIEDGYFISTPTIGSLKLPDGVKIDFEKSQIKTFSYSPYNSKRDTRDYERVVIQKGSVIAINGKFDKKAYQDSITKGVGAFLSEGFGKVLINPEFLFDITLKELHTKDEIIGIDIEDKHNKNLSLYLSKIAKQKQIEKELYRKAYENRDKFGKNTTSQWGQIRALASIHSDNAIIAELDKFLNKGVAKDKWGNDWQKLKKLINEVEQKSKFTKILSMEVSRYLKQGDKNENQ